MSLRDHLFHEEPGIQLFCGDCREVLPLVRADVLVTDPPYGVAYDSGWTSNGSIRGDSGITLRDRLLVEWGVRPAIVFGSASAPRPLAIRQVLIWDKGDWPGMGDLDFPWGPSHEEIYILGSGFVGKRSGTIIRENRLTGPMRHPNEKPVALLQKLLAYTTGTALDPFAGSGTTLEAAKNLGRRAIGIEIEPRYCEIAVKRLRQEVLPLT